MRPVAFCLAALLLCSCGDDVTGPSENQGWSLVSVWGSRGSGPGQFWDIYQFTVDPGSGNVYLPDWGNGRVQYLDREGNFLGEWSPVRGLEHRCQLLGGGLSGESYRLPCGKVWAWRRLYREWGEWGHGSRTVRGAGLDMGSSRRRVAVLDLWADQVQIYGSAAGYLMNGPFRIWPTGTARTSTPWMSPPPGTSCCCPPS
jgi:hypothetical protein